MDIKADKVLWNGSHQEKGYLFFNENNLEKLLKPFQIEEKFAEFKPKTEEIEIISLTKFSDISFIDNFSNLVLTNASAYALGWKSKDDEGLIYIKSNLIEDKIIKLYLKSIIEEVENNNDKGLIKTFCIPWKSKLYGASDGDIYTMIEDLLYSEYKHLVEGNFVFHDFENLEIVINRVNKPNDLKLLDRLELTISEGYKGGEFYRWNDKNEEEIVEVLEQLNKNEEEIKIILEHLVK